VLGMVESTDDAADAGRESAVRATCR
jgi:hypothetical protein